MTSPSSQSGITNRPPEHALIAAFDLTGGDSAANQATVVALRDLVHRELRSDLDDQGPATPKDQPSPETGELGFHDGYDRAHMTITVGLGKTGFEKLGVPAEEQPQDLVPIPWASLGDGTVLNAANGDLVVQVCSDDVYVCEHVVRRIEEELGAGLMMVWSQLGSQRYTTRQGRTSRGEGRALIGFIDGTSNLDPRHSSEDEKLVFVDPSAVGSYPPVPTPQSSGYAGTPETEFPPDLRHPPATEPEWTRQGTYLVVRGSLQTITPWDDLPLGEQEATIGRFKYSGAFLDLADDPGRLDEPPAFAADQANNTAVPVSSHVRKANPRRPEDDDRRIFRRGYPLVVANEAGLGRGLLFVAFARTISTQFEFIMRAWMRNPNFPQPGAGSDRLLAFDPTVVAGGYYFVPPVKHRNEPWTWVLPWE